MSTSWHSYSKIFAMGHRAIENLLDGPVLVEEKVDGSQFSWMIDEDGELHVRSKGAILYPDAPEKLFTLAVQTAKDLSPILYPGWTYRGEFLAKPTHGALAYNRVPAKNIILFDIAVGEEDYLSYEGVCREAERIGLEVVPLIYSGMIKSVDQFREFLDRESILGGQKIEGVVVKPLHYSKFGTDKKVLMGKFVSEAYKEVHSGAWKEANPNTGDIIQRIGTELQTQARWMKAVQRLDEAGILDNSPKDIGRLFQMVNADILEEEGERIRDQLFKYAWGKISRISTAGLAEWYKDYLLRKVFDGGA